ncbi:DUF5994 family protein [Amycolatopsis sp. YIM 10]|uniref:DUF5994 family protein n=1 Tax=Amycolatopsis sp. YIM 10 TaxID=2653857 RepID=UPI0012A841CE|nr:DUF5994 family protein [Amycolatopsis sp. YIM 10]QFU86806.1 hypothetical protein YIM_07975 [Amycolatopsis sp. YIM 10]
MQSGPHTITPARNGTEPLRSATRLRLKPKAPATGYVDGAWWPRTRDLTRELPALLTVLAVRLNVAERFTYHLEDWPPTPRRITVGGKTFRLEGFRSQAAGTVTVIGQGGRVTLLVVPPETDPEAAHDVQMAAAHRDNTDSPTTLLTGRRTPRYDSAEIAAALEAAMARWEVDGGHVPPPRG